MGDLFSTKYPDPTPPATMPDSNDPAAIRTKRQSERKIRSESSQTKNRLAPVPGTIGKEYSRSTLGAG